MKRLGKKGKEWLEKKPKLIKIYKEKKITRCENCGRKNYLAFHHRPSRSSQMAIHDFDHTRLLCVECHDYFEANDEADEKLFNKPRGFDPRLEIKIMEEKAKQRDKKSNKANWQRPHQCANCKVVVSTLICSNCGKMSMKGF